MGKEDKSTSAKGPKIDKSRLLSVSEDSAKTRSAAKLLQMGGSESDADTLNASWPSWVTLFETHIIDKLKTMFLAQEERLLSKIDQSIGTLNDRISACENSITNLQQSNGTLCNQVEELLRNQRLSDVVIRGVPVIHQENVLSVVRNISAAVEHPASQYIDAFRIKTSSSAATCPPIIARFSCHAEQRTFLHAFRSKKGIKL